MFYTFIILYFYYFIFLLFYIFIILYFKRIIFLIIYHTKKQLECICSTDEYFQFSLQALYTKKEPFFNSPLSKIISFPIQLNTALHSFQ